MGGTLGSTTGLDDSANTSVDYSSDMRRTLFNDGWTFRPQPLDRFAELMGPGAGLTPVTLPHDAVIGTERSPDAGPATGYFPGGNWEYRRTLERTAHDATTTTLEFEAVYRDAVVTVNGSVAVHQPSGYTGFFVPIDHLLHEGENEIKVEAMAHRDSRWYSGGGIHRSVWLLEAGPVHLVPDQLTVLTPEVDDDVAVLTVSATVRNRSAATANGVLHAEVLDAGGTVVAEATGPVTVFPGDEVSARHRLHVVDPHRWGPDDPYLYSCRVTLRVGDDAVDEDGTTFGIRALALDARNGLRINGEPVLLRGACVHHDNGPIGAATVDRAEERRVELLKAAGFNAIRSAHNPLSRAMLDACDRHGVLVMDETFDIWAQTKTADDYALRFDDWWEADVEAMVRKDVNHPSVVLYSIGNEIPDGSTPTGLQRSRALAEKVRSLDPTRYVTQAVTGMLVAGPAILEGIREIAERHNVDEETGVNTVALNLGELMDEAMKAPVVGREDRGGLRPPRRRRVQLHVHPLRGRRRELPQPGHRGHRDPPGHRRPGLGRRHRQRPRHRGLHVDGLGLPRRGGHRPHRLRRRDCGDGDVRLPRRLPVGGSGLWRHRHHRPPPSAVVLPRDRLRPPGRPLCGRPATGAPRPGGRLTPARGPGATWCRAGVGPGTRASRSSSRSTPTPTRSSCS